MKKLLAFIILFGLNLTLSTTSFAKKSKESPICSYGKIEYINEKTTYYYRSKHACTLKNGAKWYCRKEQTKSRKQIKKHKRKILKSVYDNKYTKINMFITPFSFKGKNTKTNKKCKLLLWQLTCKFKSCTFN